MSASHARAGVEVSGRLGTQLRGWSSWCQASAATQVSKWRFECRDGKASAGKQGVVGRPSSNPEVALRGRCDTTATWSSTNYDRSGCHDKDFTPECLIIWC
jgi:hypothetical protein